MQGSACAGFLVVPSAYVRVRLHPWGCIVRVDQQTESTPTPTRGLLNHYHWTARVRPYADADADTPHVYMEASSIRSQPSVANSTHSYASIDAGAGAGMGSAEYAQASQEAPQRARPAVRESTKQFKGLVSGRLASLENGTDTDPAGPHYDNADVENDGRASYEANREPLYDAATTAVQQGDALYEQTPSTGAGAAPAPAEPEKNTGGGPTRTLTFAAKAPPKKLDTTAPPKERMDTLTRQQRMSEWSPEMGECATPGQPIPRGWAQGSNPRLVSACLPPFFGSLLPPRTSLSLFLQRCTTHPPLPRPRCLPAAVRTVPANAPRRPHPHHHR